MNRDRINQLAETVDRLANEYAHCYSFVRDDTMPRKKAEMEAAILALRDAALSAPSEAEPPELPEPIIGSCFTPGQMREFGDRRYSKGVADAEAGMQNELAFLKSGRPFESEGNRRQPAAQPAQEMSDEQIIEVLKACDKEDHTREGWIWRQRIKWARAILAADRARGVEVETPVWIVNDLGELGVKVNGRFFFLYKGDNIEYGSYPDCQRDGVAIHDEGDPMRYRIVGKREFGEVQWPASWLARGHRDKRYTKELQFHPGLSFGKPEDGAWQDLPAAPSTPPAAGMGEEV